MAKPPPPPTPRDQMLKNQLSRRGIHAPRVLEAMRRVPRERFVLPGSEPIAYSDQALPIACEQTISQPYMVAIMTQELQLDPHHKVLEIGTGSGYQAAILCELGAEVHSIERHRLLADTARNRLITLGYNNAHVHHGDGGEGLPSESPFDRILITAATNSVPPALWEQLAEGGILVAPIGPSGTQQLQRIKKRDGKPQTTDLLACRFVPFISGELPEN